MDNVSALQPHDSIPQYPMTRPRCQTGCHNPYGPCVLGSPKTAKAAVTASSLPSSIVKGKSFTAPPPPPPYVASLYTSASYPCVARPQHHASLHDVCSFITIPSGLEAIVVEDVPALMQTDASSLPRPIFVGQCRFELTSGELHWLVEHACGVRALKIEPRGPGCFVVVVKDESSADRVLDLHQRILFDHDGVWWAETPIAKSNLAAYVQHYMPCQHSRRSRLPRDSMIVERQRGTLNPLRSLQQPVVQKSDSFHQLPSYGPTEGTEGGVSSASSSTTSVSSTPLHHSKSD